ncbi:MAG: hypothetical protein GTN89_12265 [Acidobacteria bacterium]|nr:hypothetical protein [Acidobacteriota bacterium]NIM63255.1 hypothetical protein [Acidobacteriota bacterium]NIO60048.1 hypothetical protein [Acidobacteriota bacterium]NIQ31119.1 hypothetical protein [Acidobacteriota bacterium]NIQ86228.1 hypothetical protein [Acidobacteriota bacterium]
MKDTSGRFLAGVEILVISPSASSAPVRPVASVRSDADGRFLIERLEAGAYQIAALKRGYRTYIGTINTRVDQWIQLVLYPHTRLEQSGVPKPEDDAWGLRLPRRNILRETDPALPEFEVASARRPRLSDLPINLKVDQLFKVATDLRRAPSDESVVQGLETRLDVAIPLGTRGNVAAKGSRERLKNSRYFDGSAPTARDADRLGARFSYDTSIDTRIRVEAEYAGRNAEWAARDGVLPAIDHEVESWRGALGFEKQLGPATHMVVSLDYAHADLVVPADQALSVSNLDSRSTNRAVLGSGTLTRIGERGRRFELDFDAGHLDLSSRSRYATSGGTLLRFNGLAGWTGGFRAREAWNLAQRFSLIYGVGYRHVVRDSDASVWTPHLGGRLKLEPLQVEWIATYYSTDDWSETTEPSSGAWEPTRQFGYEAAVELPLAEHITLSGSVESRPLVADRRATAADTPISATGPAYVTDGNAMLDRNRVTLRRETPALFLFAELSRAAIDGSVAAALAYDLPFQEIAERGLDYYNGRLGLRFVPQGTLVLLDLRDIRESRRDAPDGDSAQRQVELTWIQDLLQRDDLGRWRFLMSLSMAEWSSGDPGDLRQIATADRLDATDGRLSAGLSLEF